MPRYVSSQPPTDSSWCQIPESIAQSYTSPRTSTTGASHKRARDSGVKLGYRGMLDAPGRRGPATDTFGLRIEMMLSRKAVAFWRLVPLTIAYFVAGKFGLSLAFVNASASAVWPPTGIAFAAFLLLGSRAWPAILVGAFLVNVTTAGSVATSIGIAVGNTLEGRLGADLVRLFANGRGAFDRARDVFKFVVLAGLFATTVSATIGVTSLTLAGYAAWLDYGPIWFTWWLGDAVGALVVGPLIVLWCARIAAPRSWWRVLEGAALFAAVIVVGSLVFFGFVGQPLTFLCLPP